MIALVLGGILRAVTRIASTVGRSIAPTQPPTVWSATVSLSSASLVRSAAFGVPGFRAFVIGAIISGAIISGEAIAADSERGPDSERGTEQFSAPADASANPMVAAQPDDGAAGPESSTSVHWGFGRQDDPTFQKLPLGWKRYEGRGYPKYIDIEIRAKNQELERVLKELDAGFIKCWQSLNRRFSFSANSLPPSVVDLLVDRYLHVEMDGGQAKYQSPPVPTDRNFQYRFSCSIMTQGLRHDSARAELIFMDPSGKELEVHSTRPLRGTHDWTMVTIDLVRPPVGADRMAVRLRVDRGEDGLEDIKGRVGFDNIRIQPYPQLQIATTDLLGVYKIGEPVEVEAKILGLSKTESQVLFRLFDSEARVIAQEQLTAQSRRAPVGVTGSPSSGLSDSEVIWRISGLEPGFYRVIGSIVGRSTGTLATETTLAVIDDSLGGPPRGSFGWTLPDGHAGVAQRDLAQWLRDLGVAWVKYPCWLAPDDTVGAEETAGILSKLQEVGIQTVGMLDHPPENQVVNYTIRGRRNLVAAMLFQDAATWQPLLEPVMTRLTLKVRTWQLGAERDVSFLGRPRLSESVQQISTGLQGFGQPIDVAISWPWLERELPPGDASWQAVCRSSDPALGVKELDAYLTQREKLFAGQGPQTWLLLDPIARSQYRRDDRIRDLVLRMATIRSHRVQAAFVSDPRDPEHGLLRPNGSPDELLLPWRTTSRLIGDLRNHGSLHLRCGAENLVFAGPERAVVLLWASEPKEELIYLGERVKMVDVWGKVTELPNEVVGNQLVQRIPIGPLPKFVTNVDPTLLAFRMSVDLNPKQIDSYLGERQQLSLSFANPTRESLVGQFWVRPPETWSIDSPMQGWEILAGRSALHQFDVVLGNTSRIGQYELPIQFQVETAPPQVITVYKTVTVGPEKLDLEVTTRLLRDGDLRVQIEMTNRGETTQSYDCMLFPSANRQYQRCTITIPPGQTIQREIHWPEAEELIGKRMLLRADEKDGPRVFNHTFDVTR